MSKNTSLFLRVTIGGQRDLGLSESYTGYKLKLSAPATYSGSLYDEIPLYYIDYPSLQPKFAYIKPEESITINVWDGFKVIDLDVSTANLFDNSVLKTVNGYDNIGDRGPQPIVLDATELPIVKTTKYIQGFNNDFTEGKSNVYSIENPLKNEVVVSPVTTFDLDIDDQDDDVRFDISTLENANIGELYGVTSQEFDLPGTEKNNRFFNHVYRTLQQDVPGIFRSVDCSVLYNGKNLLRGDLQLQQITVDNGITYYKVLLTDRVVSFKEALNNKKIYQSNLSLLDHDYTMDNILASWEDNGLLGGDVFYPLIDRGDDGFYSTASLGKIELGGDTEGYFTHAGTPAIVQQFTPAVRTKRIVDAIFEQAGFTYESTFITSSNAEFYDSYMLLCGSENLGINVGSQTIPNYGIITNNSRQDPPNARDINSFLGNFYINQSFASNTYFQHPIATPRPFTNLTSIYPSRGGDTDRFDEDGYPYGAFAESTRGTLDDGVAFTALVTGTYTFQFKATYLQGATTKFIDGQDEFLNNFSPGYFTLELRDASTGDRLATISEERISRNLDTKLGQSGDTEWFKKSIDAEITINLIKDQKIAPTLAINTSRNGYRQGLRTAILFGTDIIFQTTKQPLIYDLENNPIIVPINRQFDADVDSLDVLRGIVEKFNLVIVPHPTRDRTMIIETFKEWIRQGDIIDWSNKFDESQAYFITSPVIEQPNEIDFADEEDYDRFVDYSTTNFPNLLYGTKKFYSPSDITEGETQIGSFFAPLVLGSINTINQTSLRNAYVESSNSINDTFILPHLYEQDGSRDKRAFRFVPRIGYKTPKLTANASIDGTDTKIYFSDTLKTNVREYDWYVTISNYSALNANFFGNNSNGTNLDIIPPSLARSQVKNLNFDDYQYTIYFPQDMVPGYRPSALYKQQGFINVEGFETDIPGAYESYWKEYIDSLYDPQARKMTCNIYFDPQELNELQLNNIYFIKDSYWRINKIIGFNASYPESTQVELLSIYTPFLSDRIDDCEVGVVEVESTNIDCSIEVDPDGT